jgi:hypothetical protein
MPVQVSDSASNANEQIAQAAEAVGRSIRRRRVFDAIYTGKRRTKTVQDVAEHTRLTRKQVLEAAKPLATKHVVEQIRHDGDTAYSKIDFIHAHKHRILSLASDPRRLARFPTKRKVLVRLPKTITLRASGAKAIQLTMDDIDSFRSARVVRTLGPLPEHVSERAFKRGVQAILGEPGKFMDWGGEKNDLLSTRLRLRGERRTVAFGFKGPAVNGVLTPKKMGKNGDQIQRLFQSAADVFIVQYSREIDQSILDQMRPLATAKSLMEGKTVWFGVIDGVDSNRIYVAYRKKFSS